MNAKSGQVKDVETRETIMENRVTQNYVPLVFALGVASQDMCMKLCLKLAQPCQM